MKKDQKLFQPYILDNSIFVNIDIEYSKTGKVKWYRKIWFGNDHGPHPITVDDWDAYSMAKEISILDLKSKDYRYCIMTLFKYGW